ncbi:hypothetical protein ACWY4P_11425 [Streptomyces sp. LZ34]
MPGANAGPPPLPGTLLPSPPSPLPPLGSATPMTATATADLASAAVTAWSRTAHTSVTTTRTPLACA